MNNLGESVSAGKRETNALQSHHDYMEVPKQSRCHAGINVSLNIYRDISNVNNKDSLIVCKMHSDNLCVP